MDVPELSPELSELSSQSYPRVIPRQSYGDLRLLHEAPGHLFLGHESEDLTSFLQIAMLNGWGGYILTQADYLNAFFSHDEYIDFFAAEGGLGLFEDIRKEFGTVEHPPKDV